MSGISFYMGIFVALIIGISLLGSVWSQTTTVNDATKANGSVNGTTLTVLNLVPILFAIGIVGVAIRIIASRK